MANTQSMRFSILAAATLCAFSLSEALNVGVQLSDASVSVTKECSRKCESAFCSVAPFLRYGKYCGLLYSGCPGEKPCDGLDSCCLSHDACVQAKNNDYLSQECSQGLLDCISAFKAAGEHAFKGNTCDVDEVADTISVVIEAALIAATRSLTLDPKAWCSSNGAHTHHYKSSLNVRASIYLHPAMAQVQLLGAWASPFKWRVVWVLKLKDVEYKDVEEDVSNKSPQLLRYNPVYKKIPVLLHAEKPISESMVIIEYIDETWKLNPILPEDAYDRVVARFWAKFGDDKCVPAIWTFLRSVGEDQEKALEDSLESLKTLEEHGIKEKKFFGGDTFGFADIVLGWIAFWLPVIEDITGVKMLEPHSFPNLHAWKENFLSLPIIKENLPPRDETFALFNGQRKQLIASTTTSK